MTKRSLKKNQTGLLEIKENKVKQGKQTKQNFRNGLCNSLDTWRENSSTRRVPREQDRKVEMQNIERGCSTEDRKMAQYMPYRISRRKLPKT